MNKFIKILLSLTYLVAFIILSIDIYFFCDKSSFINIAHQEDIEFSPEIQNNTNPNNAPSYNQNLPLKIPAISHHIWLTSHNKPHEITDADMGFILNTFKVLDSGPLKWQHILWVNEPTLIPRSIALLQKHNIQVKHINELNSLELNNDVAAMIKKNSFSEASDVLRYLALQKYGGLYFDTDYELFKPVDNLMQIYDFIGIEHHYYHHKKDELFDVINGAFIAAKKSHPIMNEALRLVDRNLHNKNVPTYIKLSLFDNKIWVKVGPMVLTVAIYKVKNKTGYNDVIFKSKYFYPKCTNINASKAHEVFGCHDLNGNWFGDN